jgi:phosphoglycerol transferase MdoB-like AlkP superfamily enzyme
VPPLLVALVVPRRVRAWLLLVAGVFGSLVILTDVVYYRFFGDVFSAPALLAIRQTGRVVGSIRTLVTPGLVWLIADWPFAFWLVARMTLRRDAATTLRARAGVLAAAVTVLVVAGAALSAPRVLASIRLDQMFRDRAVVEQLGPFGFHAYDAWTYAHATWLRPPVTDAQVEEVMGFFVERTPGRAGGGPTFGAARGRNLIVVQVESLQDFAVDFKAGTQEVMPHLRRWVRDSVRFTNVTDQTSEGRTSDAEFTTMTSVLPLDHGAVAFRYPGNHPVALPRVLREHGYHTLSAVAFEPGFWNRQVMHPAYGFDESLFESDFQLTEQIGWGLNDRDFLQQAARRLERLPRPFAAWLITLSLHHPFADFPAAHKALTLGALDGTSFGNYLHTMRFFDDALDAFRATLARSRLLDDSVIVVFGDHDAGFARDAALEYTIGSGAASAGLADLPSNTMTADAAWVLNDRVPVFVRVPHVPGTDPRRANALEGVRSLPAGQTDLAPTILALLGVDPASLPFLGRNLLAADGDRPVPRPYGDWLDAHHLSFTRDSERVCFDLARSVADDPGACRAADAAVRREREVSRLVVTEDLQQRIRERLKSLVR